MSKKEHQAPKKKKPTQGLFVGKLDITRSGMGYVIVEGEDKDIIIKPGDFNTALHGDIVKVALKNDNYGANKRKEGNITEVITRKQSEYIGTLQMGTNFAFCVCNTDKPMPDFYIPFENLNGAKDKDKVVVQLTEWKKANKSPIGKVIDIMTQERENEMAMKALLLENGFALGFSDEVMAETDKLPHAISKAEIKNRKDFRDVLTFTIDPLDAKDFDDAISYQVLKNGNIELGVHIADVSHYVTPHTALDKAAYEKATSVYLPDRVSPMLPERISNELCSLRPKEDKLTFSTVFEITPEGKIKKQWIGRTVIHSNHRFTYEDVQEMIEGADGLYKQEVLVLDKLAKKYRAERFKVGAINFSSQEVRFKLDEKGKPIGIVIKESKDSHQLIEEFMLLANKTVATYVAGIKYKDADVPFAYRVHDQPSEEKLALFIEFARRYGHKFNVSTPEKIAHSFNEMLAAAKGKPEQHVLESLGIRTMAKAVYTTKNIGHYGLGFQYYAHFTSPIRRYPDVMVHRVLQECLDNNIKPDKKADEKCKHCSDKERSAMETERAANKYKQVEYLKNFIGDEFDAVISGVAAFGFWAETVEHKCEGLISMNQLMYFDEFRFIESDYCLLGRHSGTKFAIGDKIRIKVVAANLEKRQLDFEWVSGKDWIDEKGQKGQGGQRGQMRQTRQMSQKGQGSQMGKGSNTSKRNSGKSSVGKKKK
jgi:ribonuclease R